MEVNLTEEQQEYVRAYNQILTRLNTIQNNINLLQQEAAEVIEELNALRAKEREAFPEE